jgi:hypothetical protein
VRALVGGFAFSRQQFNHATSAKRQPGSAFKPFLYSAALEQGIMPETLVDDSPLLNPDGGVPDWNPQNSDGTFDGDITLREGLVRSKNLVSVRLLQQLGLDPVRNWVARFGFDLAQQPQNLTMALGTGSVTPLQLALAYAVLANGGHRVAPVLIERIVGPQGQVLFEAPPATPLDENSRAVEAARPLRQDRHHQRRRRRLVRRLGAGHRGRGLDGLRRTAQPGRGRIGWRPGAADLDRRDGPAAAWRAGAAAGDAGRRGGRGRRLALRRMGHGRLRPACATVACGGTGTHRPDLAHRGRPRRPLSVGGRSG